MDDTIGLSNDDLSAAYTSQENLRLPATPFDEHRSDFKRSYSLPDNLDDDYNSGYLSHGEPTHEGASRRSFMGSANFFVKPEGSLLKRGSWRRDLRRRNQRRRHPDEVELIMRRGWFDIRRSIRVKVSTMTKNVVEITIKWS